MDTGAIEVKVSDITGKGFEPYDLTIPTEDEIVARLPYWEFAFLDRKGNVLVRCQGKGSSPFFDGALFGKPGHQFRYERGPTPDYPRRVINGWIEKNKR
jgi:hypothetical protein